MNDTSNNQETTHFGYEEVPMEEKQEKVGRVFRSVANRYDVMNDIMSLGTHRLIKRFTIELSALRPGQKVLDLAGGTGDFSLRFSTIVEDEGQVVLADINDAMLKWEGIELLMPEKLIMFSSSRLTRKNYPSRTKLSTASA